MIEETKSDDFKVIIIDSDSSHKTYHHYQMFSLIPNFRDVCIALKNHYIDSSFFCFHKSHIESIKERLAENLYQIIFVHIDNCLEPNLFEILEKKRQEKKEFLIIVFGYLATRRPQEILEAYSFIDYCIQGHLDFLIPQICIAVQKKGNLDSFPDLISSSHPSRQENDHKKQVDFPDIGAFYQTAGDQDLSGFHRKDQQVVLLQSSVGCPYKCSFCRMSTFHHNHWKRGYLIKDMDKILSEIKFYHLEKGVQHFKFFDFNFLGTEKQALWKANAFAEGIKRENLTITYEFNCRTNCISQDVIEPLKETGLKLVAVGIESMSPSQLERFHKKITVEQHTKALEILSKNNIFAQCYVILFDPLVTIEEIKESLNGLIKLARHASILTHEKIVLYSNVAYYKNHHQNIKGLKPMPNSLGTAFSYEFNDPVCEKVFPVFEKLSLSYKAESEKLFKEIFSGKITGIQEYILIRFIHLQRLVMLKESIELLTNNDLVFEEMLQNKLAEVEKNMIYLSDKLLKKSERLSGTISRN